MKNICSCYPKIMCWGFVDMMTSSNGNIFHVTGPLCGEFAVSLVNSPHKGQWRGALMFYLICAWTNGWVNNREAGDLRRHHDHCDVTAMSCIGSSTGVIRTTKSDLANNDCATNTAASELKHMKKNRKNISNQTKWMLSEELEMINWICDMKFAV